jgi:periplasmic protein TonB
MRATALAAAAVPRTTGANQRRPRLAVESTPGVARRGPTVAERRARDGRVFRAGIAISVGLHAAVLLAVTLPVAPQDLSVSRAPLQAVEAPAPTAVPPPQQAVRIVPEAEVPVNAIPVPVLDVPPQLPVVTEVAGAPMRGPAAPARPDSAAAATAPALAGVLARSQYELDVARWVERQRDYPLAARRRGIEGTAIVRVRVAADGALLGAQIVRDTGHAVLDRAALGMVERAAPYPDLPDALGSQVEVLVPIQFSLGR